ncbi:hypothetical protein X781_16110 [Mannheimia sp. USDA-ARS-USMARC-1261]|nr:hypothetical protein X781_16110 [Mannheimia sp. USDA-ARS-USMARC-1261]
MFIFSSFQDFYILDFTNRLIKQISLIFRATSQNRKQQAVKFFQFFAKN